MMVRADRLALSLVLSSLLLGVPASGFLYRYSKDYFHLRFGKGQTEQRLTMVGPGPFRRTFLEFCAAVKAVVPEGDRILVQPSRVLTLEGRARWYLYMNLELHPRQILVRAPELASGTLVDYPRWIEESTRVLGVVESIEVDRRIDELGIGWRILYPASRDFPRGAATLERRVKGGWEAVELQQVRFGHGEVMEFDEDSEAGAPTAAEPAEQP